MTDPAAERQALIAELALQKRDAEARADELARVERELAYYRGSVAWGLFERLRRLVYALVGGRSSLAGRTIGAALRRIGGASGQTPVEPDAVAPRVEPATGGDRDVHLVDGHGPHVLIADQRVPTPDRDAGSLRMRHVVAQLVELGCRVSFIPAAGPSDDRYGRELRELGVELLDRDSDLAAHLVAYAGTTRLAILSRPDVASRHLHVVREYAPAARVAYDTVDLHHLRERRRAEVTGNDDLLAKAAGLRELELALARASDVTLAVSVEERSVLLGEEPGLTVEILPTLHEPWTEVPPRAGRAGVLFVGGFQHEPNAAAARELAERVMPLVWEEVEDARLTIVGADPPAAVRALADERVSVAGWVEDLRPELAAAVVAAAPIRYGAGVKGKVVEAMSAGLPVVTTRLGAEGVGAEHRESILIGDEPSELARQIVELHRDRALWQRLSANGRALVARTASPVAQRPLLERLLRPLA